MSAKLDTQKDDTSKIVTYAPSMPGNKLGIGLTYFFDEVFYMDTTIDANGNKQRYLQTSMEGYIEAKDRSGKLDKTEAPNLGAIINKISA
jgi:hypothetical protein